MVEQRFNKFIEKKAKPSLIESIKRHWKQLYQERAVLIRKLQELLKPVQTPVYISTASIKTPNGKYITDFGEGKPYDLATACYIAHNHIAYGQPKGIIYSTKPRVILGKSGILVPSEPIVPPPSSQFTHSHVTTVEAGSYPDKVYNTVGSVIEEDGLAFFDDVIFLLYSATGEPIKEDLFSVADISRPNNLNENH
jgi:hypothetical protein